MCAKKKKKIAYKKNKCIIKCLTAPLYRQSIHVKHLMAPDQVHIDVKSHKRVTPALSEPRLI